MIGRKVARKMDLPFGLIPVGFVMAGALATYLIFRRTSGMMTVHRMPLFLTCAVPLLYMGFAQLPFAFEPIFTKIIGHNIRDVYHFPRRADGLEFSESWWIARWQDPLQHVAFNLMAIGVIWAAVNAATDRERKANIAALATGIGVVVLWIVLYAASGAFLF